LGKKDFQRYIDLFKPIMEALHALLGDKSEFILHDLSTPESSVVAIVGSVTQRQIGAPATNLVMKELERNGDEARDMVGYLSLTKDGRQLKSTTVFIRDEDNRIVGCFCCNVDLTEFQVAEKVLRDFCATRSIDDADTNGEVFAQDIGDVVEDIIRFEINRFGKPVPHMSRADKLQIIATLDSKGVFGVKGAVDLMAHFLGSSVFTIYNYLKEVRSPHRNID
jgi:predicted transcriptional regulator YheO